MCKCGRKYCAGYILLHPKELSKITEITDHQQKEIPNARFIVDPSPTSGELKVFYEVHVINDPNTSKENIGSIVFTKQSEEDKQKRMILAEAYEKVMSEFIEKKRRENMDAV